MRRYVRAKLHGVRVTGADLNYHGSITLDPEVCRAAGLDPLEFVEIWNKMSGARISTYVLYGAPGSRCCILNGAAARTCQIGDELIIAASHFGEVEGVIEASPRVLTFDARNEIDETLTYRVFRNEAGEPDMTIEDRTGSQVPVRLIVG